MNTTKLTRFQCECGRKLLVEGAVIGKEALPVRPYKVDPDACVRLCEAIAAFWGDGICDAAVYPGAYLTGEDTPIRDLVRAAVGWRKP